MMRPGYELRMIQTGFRAAKIYANHYVKSQRLRMIQTGFRAVKV